MKSEHISRIWPESLRRKAGKYFPVQPKIDALLSFKPFRSSQVLLNIHSCIHNPLMENYILWVFGSNELEQRIISKVLNANPEKLLDAPPEVLEGLAAGAACERNYLLAEKYLHSATDKLDPQDNFHKYPKHLYYTAARMYLLFMSGKKEQAERVGQEYVSIGKTDKIKRRRDIDHYWNWIVRNVSPINDSNKK